MKVRAVQQFMDRAAGSIRKEGEVFEVTKSRLDEINTAGFGVLVEAAGSAQGEAVPEAPEAAPAAEVAEEPTEALVDFDRSKLTIAHIKEILEERGVEFRGGMTKPELLDLLDGSQ